MHPYRDCGGNDDIKLTPNQKRWNSDTFHSIDKGISDNIFKCLTHTTFCAKKILSSDCVVIPSPNVILKQRKWRDLKYHSSCFCKKYEKFKFFLWNRSISRCSGQYKCSNTFRIQLIKHKRYPSPE